jgi:hypothetical protein
VHLVENLLGEGLGDSIGRLLVSILEEV